MSPIRIYRDAWNGALHAHRLPGGLAETAAGAPMDALREPGGDGERKPVQRPAEKDHRATR